MRVGSEAKSHRSVLDALDPCDLARVGGGLLWMGDGGVACERPVHEVRVASFRIGRSLVSRAAYRRFLDENPREPLPRFWTRSRWSEPDAPVVGVSWEAARRFAAWAGCRLPSEGEWEYVGRLSDCVRRSLGICDLFGKVVQWLEDDWHASYIGFRLARSEP